MTINELATASREALAAAEELVTKLQLDLGEAMRKPKQITNGWASGNGEHSGQDLVTAQAEIVRLEELQKAAREEVKRATRKLVNELPDLAEAVADGLGGKVMSIPLTPVVVNPPVPKQSDLPVAYVLQRNPSSAEARSMGVPLKGEIEVIVFAPEYVGKLEGRAIGHKLEDNGVRLKEEPTASSSKVADGVVRLTARIDVIGAWARVPRLASNPTDPGVAARELVAHLESKLQNPYGPTVGYRMHRDGTTSGGNTKDRARTVKIEAKSPRLAAVQVTGAERRTTVTVELTLRPNDGLIKGADIARKLPQVLTDFEKTLRVSGFGVAESVNVLGSIESGTRACAAKVEIVFLSQVV